MKNGTDLAQKSVQMGGIFKTTPTTLYLTQVGDKYQVRTYFQTIKRFATLEKAQAFFANTEILEPIK